MPIYEYECTSCHHNFDLIQKINAEPVKQCPRCFNNSVTKLVSAAGFQLKGTGWYETDFKNKGTKPKESSSSKDSSATNTDTGTKQSAPAPDKAPTTSSKEGKTE